MSLSTIDEKTVITINNGRFIEAVNYHEHHVHGVKRKGLKILSKHVASGALHNSGERFNPPKCHPNTRIAVLDRINHWARTKRDSGVDYTPIMWLSGPAGAGKSAIAQTLAEQWDKEGRLAGSFFFSRDSSNRNEKTLVVSTVAYQLYRAFHSIQADMKQAIEDDPLIFSKTLQTQMEELLNRPLNAAFPEPTPQPPKVILLDGLDECSGNGAQEEILSLLASLLQLRNVPLIAFIASRSEHDIRRAFNRPALARLTSTLVLDDEFNANADIELFLRCKFDEVKTNHMINDISWPPEEAIQDIILKASGQFIYASTVVKYIERPRSDPRRSLEVVQGIEDIGQDTPYAQLDALYTFILSSIADTSYDAAMDVFAILTTNMHDIWSWKCTSGVTVTMLTQFLYMDVSEVYRHLVDLHSILYIPPLTDHVKGRSKFVRFFHASFGDFLGDHMRAKRFFLGRGAASTRITNCLFKHILAGMSSINIMRTTPTRGWSYWRDLEQLTCDYLRSSDVNDRLRIGLEAAMYKDEEEYCRYLKEVGLRQTKPREPLFKFLGDCDLKREILLYIKKCHKEGESLVYQRLTTNAKLLPFHLEVVSSSLSCKSLACSRHLR